MNAVGIDVSKGKSMVTILRPFGEIVSSPHEIRHTSDQIDSLIREIRSLDGDTRIVMEYTGRYHEPMARLYIRSIVGQVYTKENPCAVCPKGWKKRRNAPYFHALGNVIK